MTGLSLHLQPKRMWKRVHLLILLIRRINATYTVVQYVFFTDNRIISFKAKVVIYIITIRVTNWDSNGVIQCLVCGL